MHRREFLKYLLSASACMCCACQKDDKDTNSKSLWHPGHIAIPICYHCNLNCAYCSHFSPIAPKYEMPVEVFERDIKQLRKISDNNVRFITLLGGEPLLHNDIVKLIEILVKYFPNTRKRILTNGLLFDRMPDDFWIACKENKIKIECSLYPLSDKTPSDKFIKEIESNYNIKIKTNQRVFKLKFNKMNLTKNPKKGSENNFKKCVMNVGCAQLDNGILYPCCVISNLKFFNEKFKDYSFELDKRDYLDIYKVTSAKEVADFFASDRVFCKYCNYAKETAFWRLSKHELSEWYDVNS